MEAINAIGIKAMADRYGGTYVISDIAFEFASWGFGRVQVVSCSRVPTPES
jgi:hypothetical protein